MALLMALEEAQSLQDRFKAVRRLVSSWRLTSWALGSSYQGFSKALIRVSPRLLRAMAQHLRSQMPQIAGPHWKLGRWVVMGADGSKFNLPRTQAHLKRFGSAGKRASSPQAYLTTILHLTTGLCWDAWIGPGHADERGHVLRMLHRLPPEVLLGADAGFVGYRLWSALHNRAQHFLIRVGGNVRLLRHLGYAVREYAGLVYVWPDQERRAGRRPLILRLIQLNDGRSQVTLLTNVVDPKELSDTQAAQIYRLRWGIELWYRQLKQTAARRQLASRAPAQATVELAWLVLAMGLLGLLGVQDAVRRGADPLTFSPSAVLATLRDLAQQPSLHGGLRTLRRRLAGCKKDTIQRTAPKCRVRWATKKREHPPTAPRITEASPTQVQAAAELKCKTPRP